MTIRMPGEEQPEYQPDPLGRPGMGRWRQRRRGDPFGRPLSDVLFERFRTVFDPHTEPGDIFGERPFELAAPVGREGENRRFDVARIESFLARTGFLDLAPTEGPTGYFGTRLEDAIRRFQTARGLAVDGTVDPGGPTLSALAQALANAEGTGAQDTNGGTEQARDDAPEKETQVAMNSPWELGDGPDAMGSRLVGRLLRRAFPVPGRGPQGGGRGIPAPPPALPPPGGSGPRERGAPPPAAPESAEDEARRQALADDFVKQVTAPLESNRGDGTTQEGNDIVARACRQVIEEDYPDLADLIKHVGGAHEDGEGGKLSEKYIANKERAAQELDARMGSSHPDLTWQHTGRDEKAPDAFAHADTSTMGKRGNPVARERRSFAQLVENVGADLATMIAKLRPGMDKDEYEQAARDGCRKIFRKWLGAPTKERVPESNGEMSVP